ncbi:MAG: TolC family protein [Elusimicrobia bacterium]|nr:TolC family protein [Elusimicrobiota bacterium]MDE2424415.1 TolC family protein [Elusimicrobiota bacterium]
MLASCLALALLAAPARAAAPLTLSDCVSLAENRSVQAVAAALAERQALFAKKAADSARLPRLFAFGQLLRSDDATTNLPDDNNATVALEQRLYPFDAGWRRVAERDALYHAAVLERIATTQDVALAVRRLFFAILQDEDAIESIDQVQEQFHRLLLTVLPKFTIGNAPAFDPVKVRISLADLARTRELAQARLDQERETLAQVIGSTEAATLALSPVSGTPAGPGPDFAAQVLASNAALQAQAARVDAAELGVKAARALRYPSLLGHLDYNYAAQATSQMTPGWTASLGLELPLFDWGGISARVAQKRAAADAERNALDADRQRVLASLAGALSRAKAHEDDEQRLSRLLPQVKRIALEGARRYRVGATGILEATDAIDLWLNTLLQERAAYYGYLADLALLQKLSGGTLKVSYER